MDYNFTKSKKSTVSFVKAEMRIKVALRRKYTLQTSSDMMAVEYINVQFYYIKIYFHYRSAKIKLTVFLLKENYLYLYILRNNRINRVKTIFLPILLTLASCLFQDTSISNPYNLRLAPAQVQTTDR